MQQPGIYKEFILDPTSSEWRESGKYRAGTSLASSRRNLPPYYVAMPISVTDFGQAAASIVVETKLSTNGKLLHAYAIYQKAERSKSSILLVQKVKEESLGLRRLKERYEKDKREGAPGPKVIIVDALPKESASKARLL